MVGLERFELRQTGGLTNSGASDNKSNNLAGSARGTALSRTPCPKLARVVNAWSKIPLQLRAAILAIVEAAGGGQP
jgi:hypothetical protein